MAEATFNFPRGFLWGTATSSHQVEGHNTNNNWHKWEEDGKITQGQRSGAACDWWGGRWREDFDRAAENGQNAHRLSIEWSRIQPAPDRWDEDALDHYRQMVRGLKERGITPLITLHHFTDPIWLCDLGAWENDAVIAYFRSYVQRVVEGLQDYTAFWCTLNEPNLLAASSYLLGTFPPGKHSIRALYNVVQNLVKAHAAAYQVIHSLQPAARVGLAHHFRGFTPAKAWSPFDRWAVNNISGLLNESFPRALKSGVLRFLGIRKSIPQAKDTQDYFGLNYYTREMVAFSPFRPGEFFSQSYLNPEAEHSPNDFIANEPHTFFKSLKWAQNYGLPVFVTENGVEDAEDTFRPKYLIQHIHQMWRGVNFNWPVRGYFHWTLVDNFEWERGWTQRFGLWALDPKTQTRQKRKSADLYEAICKANSLSTAMVAMAAPELLESMFPG